MADTSIEVRDASTGTTLTLKAIDLGDGTFMLGGGTGDASQTTLLAVNSKLGTIVNTGGTTTVGGILGDVSNSSIATRLGAIQTRTDLAFAEQASVAVTITAATGSETNFLNLATASTKYNIRNLRLKCADPGADTVTVKLYEFINDVLTNVDSYDITTANYAVYYSLMDLFGISQIVGKTIKITVEASANGPYAVTGQYEYAKVTI